MVAQAQPERSLAAPAEAAPAAQKQQALLKGGNGMVKQQQDAGNIPEAARTAPAVFAADGDAAEAMESSPAQPDTPSVESKERAGPSGVDSTAEGGVPTPAAAAPPPISSPAHVSAPAAIAQQAQPQAARPVRVVKRPAAAAAQPGKRVPIGSTGAIDGFAKRFDGVALGY